jgi:5-methylcytosine-specific restriction endonuclease McrA
MDKDVYKEVRLRSNEFCENCGIFCGDRLELHHILRRRVTATTDNCLMLCYECHRGKYGVHGAYGRFIDVKLKLKLQDLYISRGLEEDAVRKIMGGKLYGKF